MTASKDLYTLDSLDTLLKKARTIRTVNKGNLKLIDSRKGQDVITSRQYKLQLKPTSTSGECTSQSKNDIVLTHTNTTRSLDDILGAWRYNGEQLTKETIVYDDQPINLRLETFSDVTRLHQKCDKLLETYSQDLMDKPRSRQAVQGLIRNMKRLQKAIQEIHAQTIDAKDSAKENDSIAFYVDTISKGLKALQTNLPDLEIDIRHEPKQDIRSKPTIPSFHDCKEISCNETLTAHDCTVRALQPYVLNGKQHIASASKDQTIKIWDLTSNSVVATLEGHNTEVNVLTLYEQNGTPMLVSGSTGKTIKIWDLSTNSIVHTISGHTGKIWSLTTYEDDGKITLISGSRDETIKIWDLDDFSLITTLEGHIHSVTTLRVFYRNSIPYLVSGSSDTTIKIWSLRDFKLIESMYGNLEEVTSLAIIDYNGKKILANGDCEGSILLWDIEDYTILKKFNSFQEDVNTLDTIRCGEKVCLVSASWDGTMKIWDLDENTMITSLNNDPSIYTAEVFMNGDKACLASGDCKGNIRLWME